MMSTALFPMKSIYKRMVVNGGSIYFRRRDVVKPTMLSEIAGAGSRLIDGV